MRTRVVASVDAKTLRDAIRDNVSPKARIVTDELAAYRGAAAGFEGGHATVRHGAGEYARDDVHTNTAKSYFALLKRGVYGTFHQLSKEHLYRYCDEFSFRWSHRKVTDGERMVAALRATVGKRLTYG